ncbi:gamma-glutamyl-gamma-aminobutyrate hydrolase family protein [Veronia nyctiphanis]|uniref:gamma-glutamyl-gamma-aminobutyrate hydrolase family protein n=1 Tax=Veronia nyctiphanis TaxID=1278244 RepID=UPI0022A87B2A|nr:gamma-glutamyl-gamma-aminobutyrate hydrolase family protein [Veronia nyctiphanis]
MLKTVIESEVPCLAICRGFQELNVVCGGTLHQKLHELANFIEHREDKSADISTQYGLSHTVAIEPGGILEKHWGEKRVEVNSVHTQGIARLGEGLRIEAKALDGLIEAVSFQSEAFTLGVQWHPEWKVTENPFYSTIFKLFGDACRHRSSMREREYEQAKEVAERQ